MKISIIPTNAGFINKVLFFNLSDSIFSRQDIFIDNNVSIAFIFENKTIVGVDLENYMFYVYKADVDDYYGPYLTYQEAICTNAFGEIDGLFKLFSNIKFSEYIGCYEFVFDNFEYNPFTYKFTASVKDTAAKLKNILKVIQEPFQFTFEPETDFGDNVISNFLIRLDRMFQANNFTLGKKESNISIILKQDRMKIGGYRGDDYEFVVFNNNTKRHLVAYIPKLLYIDYFNISADIDNTDDFTLLFPDEKVIVSNKEDVVKAKNLFEIDIDAKEVELYVIELRKYIKLITPKADKQNILNYVVLVNDNYYIVEIDLLNKTMIMKDFEEYTFGDYNVYIKDNKLIVSKTTDTSPKSDITIETDNEVFAINSLEGIAMLNNNYTVDIEYLEYIQI